MSLAYLNAPMSTKSLTIPLSIFGFFLGFYLLTARGPITEAIQQRFFKIVKGEAPDPHGWLQPVQAPAAATSGSAKGR